MSRDEEDKDRKSADSSEPPVKPFQQEEASEQSATSAESAAVAPKAKDSKDSKKEESVVSSTSSSQPPAVTEPLADVKSKTRISPEEDFATPRLDQASASVREHKEEDLEKKIIGNVFFTCFVHHDGYGDLGHLISIASPDAVKRNLPSGYQPIYFVVCKNDAKTINFVVDSLTTAGLLHNPEKISVADRKFGAVLEKNPHLHLLPVREDCFPKNVNPSDIDQDNLLNKQKLQATVDGYIKQNPILQKQLEQRCLSAAISVATPFQLEQENKLVSVYIGEHGAPSKDPKRISTIMGFAPSEVGVLLEPKPKSDLAEQRAILLSLEDKHYLKNLLGVEEVDNKAVNDFLEHTDFTPSYFQSKPATAVAIHTISATTTKNVTFHVNKANFDYTLLDRKLFLESGISEVTILEKNKKPIIISIPEVKPPTRKCKILTGYFLNDNDFEKVFSVGSRFGGCSGDKSFEKTLSNNLIPFYQVRRWKLPFNKSTIDYLAKIPAPLIAQLFNYYQSMEECQPKQIPMLAKQIISIINTPDFNTQWEAVLNDIKKNKNLNDQLPSLFKNLLFYAKLEALAATSDNLTQAFKQLAREEKLEKTNIGNILNFSLERKNNKLTQFLYKIIFQQLMTEKNPANSTIVLASLKNQTSFFNKLQSDIKTQISQKYDGHQHKDKILEKIHQIFLDKNYILIGKVLPIIYSSKPPASGLMGAPPSVKELLRLLEIPMESVALTPTPTPPTDGLTS